LRVADGIISGKNRPDEQWVQKGSYGLGGSRGIGVLRLRDSR
jgi:hypothetical protein